MKFKYPGIGMGIVITQILVKHLVSVKIHEILLVFLRIFWYSSGLGIGISTKDEQDFGLETETETRVVSRPVSSVETT